MQQLDFLNLCISGDKNQDSGFRIFAIKSGNVGSGSNPPPPPPLFQTLKAQLIYQLKRDNFLSETCFELTAETYFNSFFLFLGCPVEDASVPFETKEFNMLDYLDAARAENFTGRRWLYEEIEDAFKDKYIAGVQIVGSPGSGKSALSSQLICSRSSSPIIHTSILGYHFCKYSDKNTQMAGKFVRNLAEMIARRLPEYGYLVSNNSFIRRSLKEDCIHYQDPVGCFQLAVLSPLRNLTNKPRANWFVVLDALDECITQGETGHSIVYLLNNKIHLFPPWLKVIVTLRNESEAFLHSSKVKTIVIDPEDSRNLKDLDTFVIRRLEAPSLHHLTRWFGNDSVNFTKLTTEVLSKSQGNFLFVNELLNNWEQTTTELRNVFDSPTSLGDLFYAYFKRLYPSEESFKSVRHILELLVSTFEPLKRKQIFELLKTGENSLDEYDFKNRLKGLSHFLHGKDNNTLTLYHLSLTEWLTSEENEDFFVSKEKGHETFCEYYIGLIKETEESKLSGYILNLAQHIALSGMKKPAFVQEFTYLPSQTINASELQNNRTLLHRAATINNSDALELVLRHFSCIDCVDDRGITPAFLAAEHGLVDNLVLLVEKGAEINRKTKTMVEFNKGKIIQALQQAINDESDISAANRLIDMSFHQSKSKVFDSSLLYAAAQGGHTSVVRFLLKNNANISMLNSGHLTAIQIAADNGHVKVVKTLYEATRKVPDKTVLYRAAADNRLEVVNFLLDIGVKDDCRSINCFKAEQRIFLGLPSPDRDETKTLCGGENDIGPGSNQRDCALEAAVALGHDEVVKSLLSKEHNARICSGYSGRALLDEVSQENNRVYVDITLGRRPLVTFIHPNGKENVNIPSLDFTESGVIECRKPLNYSVFHLLSYLSPTFEHNNTFYLSPRCRRLDAHSTSCQESKSPLAESIEQYPEKEWVISSCFDAEGFAPLHRAAQGANLVAIRYFLANGVDTSILSQNGHDALTLAVLHAGRRRLWECEGRVAADVDYQHLIRAEQAAITLLRHAVNGGFKVRCNSSKPDLTLYHLAASRGLVKFIETLFNESDLHHLDVDCANADGITPIYLANLFQQRVQDGLDNPWKKVIQIIKQHGGEMRYPREDAEYNLIYNGVYGWIPYEFTLDLRPDIKHFITSLLMSYEKSENKSFRCSFGRNLDLARENYYHDWLVTWLWRKINDTVGPVIKHSEEDMWTSKRGTRPHSPREREHFRRDMRRCSLHVRQFRRYLSRILLHKQAYPKNILKNDYWETFSKARGNYWFQRELQILMNMRHTEVFRAFACLKSLSSRLKPVYHLDARSVSYSVRQYEKNPPVDNYLNSICDSLQYIFEGYISFRISRQQPSEFRLRENEFFSRSGFFNGPVNISRQTSLTGSNPIEWPLEFFLRRSLGFFRRYDYLKTLHIGIEPRTYVHLYPDKIRQLMNRDKMWYDHA